MSMGNIGYTYAAVQAGSQMAEKQADGPEKQAHSNTNAQRKQDSVERAEKAESAEFVRDDSAETSDRDADGRQVWQRIRKNSEQNSEKSEEKKELPKDPTGKLGSILDISG